MQVKSGLRDLNKVTEKYYSNEVLRTIFGKNIICDKLISSKKYLYEDIYLLHLKWPYINFYRNEDDDLSFHFEWIKKDFIKIKRIKIKNPNYVKKETLLAVNENNFKWKEL